MGTESQPLQMKSNPPQILHHAPSTVATSDAGDVGFYDIEFSGCGEGGLTAEVLFDIKPFSEASKAHERIYGLIEQVLKIGECAFWGNNCLVDCTSRRGWRLNIAAEPASVGDEVYGFIVYKIESHKKIMQIQYIAVAENHRRRGIGSKLIKSIQRYVRDTLTRSTIERIACACLPEAVEFYQSHQFRRGKRIVADDEADTVTLTAENAIEVQIPLQYHMEWKVPRRKHVAR